MTEPAIKKLQSEIARLRKCIAEYEKAVPIGGIVWALSINPDDEYPMIPYIKREGD
jgi:hypothetical protein